MLLFEFPSQGCIFSGLFLVLLLPVFYPGATHLYNLYCLCLLFNYPNIYSISSYFRTSCEYWYIPECVCFGVVVFRFRVVGEYHGGTLSMSSRSARSSKNRILRAPLCLAQAHYIQRLHVLYFLGIRGTFGTSHRLWCLFVSCSGCTTLLVLVVGTVQIALLLYLWGLVAICISS